MALPASSSIFQHQPFHTTFWISPEGSSFIISPRNFLYHVIQPFQLLPAMLFQWFHVLPMLSRPLATHGWPPFRTALSRVATLKAPRRSSSPPSPHGAPLSARRPGTSPRREPGIPRNFRRNWQFNDSQRVHPNHQPIQVIIPKNHMKSHEIHHKNWLFNPKPKPRPPAKVKPAVIRTPCPGMSPGRLGS